MHIRRLIQFCKATILLSLSCYILTEITCEVSSIAMASEDSSDSGTVLAELKVVNTDIDGTIPDPNNDHLFSFINLPTAFCNNPSIKKLILPKETESFLNDDNYETDTALVQNYASITPNCPNLESIEVEEGNPLYTSRDGVLYNKDMTILYYCPPGKKGELIIPEGVTQIGILAFQECSKLTSIQLPSTLTRIREAAFGGNTSLTHLAIPMECPYFKTVSDVLFTKNGEQLVAYAGGKTNKSYTVPEGVKVISNAAFMGCNNLIKLMTNENLTTVGVEAFRDCENLKIVEFAKGLRDIYAGAFLNCGNLSKMNFPDGTRMIRQDAIKGCSKLLIITLPESLQDIDCEIGNVPNRSIRIYSPYLDAGLSYQKVAKGVTVYIYGESFIAPLVIDRGVKTCYYSKPYATVSAATKAPDRAASGTGKTDITWYKKSTKVFYINNPDQLAGLSKLVSKGIYFKGKKIVLMKDLDLSCYPNWQPIGTEDGTYRIFAGTFDGNNHTIYNLRINNIKGVSLGLFGVNRGEIKNLIIHDADILGNTNVGILTGRGEGPINSCKVSGSVQGKEGIGGLAGVCFRNINQCSVNAAVQGIHNVGGITGYNSQDITDCTNSGSVTGYDCVGGYSGNSSGGNISDCFNDMIISGDINVSGFLGSISSDALITGCTNRNTVSGNEKVGGIAGNYNFGGSIESCTNEGTITGTYYVGGIAGYLAIGSMESCVNKGDVSGKYGVAGVLGMLGYVYPVYDRVLECMNAGRIDGMTYTAEIIGKDVSKQGVSELPGD